MSRVFALQGAMRISTRYERADYTPAGHDGSN